MSSTSSLEANILDVLQSFQSANQTSYKDVTTMIYVDIPPSENVNVPKETNILKTAPPTSLQQPATCYKDIETQTTSAKERPPPLGLSGCNVNPKRDILLGRNTDTGTPKTKRTLLLTDFVLGKIHPRALSFHRNEKCIKKMMYYLTDVSNYEPEFAETDTVVLSAGVNDLTRKYLYPGVHLRYYYTTD